MDLTVGRSLPVKFSSPEELQEISNALGVKTDIQSITYCNSGQMAAGGWFVMHANIRQRADQTL